MELVRTCHLWVASEDPHDDGSVQMACPLRGVVDKIMVDLVDSP